MGPEHEAHVPLLWLVGALMNHPTAFSLAALGSRGGATFLIVWPVGAAARGVPLGPPFLPLGIILGSVARVAKRLRAASLRCFL